MSPRPDPRSCGFLLPHADAEELCKREPALRDVVFPFLTADELLGERHSLPTRYVIDFAQRSRLDSQQFGAVFARVKQGVLPDREEAARQEVARNAVTRRDSAESRVNRHHSNFLERWWQLS